MCDATDFVDTDGSKRWVTKRTVANSSGDNLKHFIKNICAYKKVSFRLFHDMDMIMKDIN